MNFLSALISCIGPSGDDGEAFDTRAAGSEIPGFASRACGTTSRIQPS
jgi:hypothetical protein